MTIGELIEFLSAFPKNLPVILSTDEEGNGYNHLRYCAESLYDPTERYYIDTVYLTHEQLDEEIAKNKGWSEEDRAPDYYVAAMILSP